MSNNAASASPAPGGIGLWVKVIIFVALVIAGYAYIWSLVHAGSDQAAAAGAKPQAAASMPKVGPPMAQPAAEPAPTGAKPPAVASMPKVGPPMQRPAAEPAPTGETQPRVSATASSGPGEASKKRAVSMPAAPGKGSRGTSVRRRRRR